MNGVVYAGSQDKNVYALDAYSGKLIWKYATGGSIEDSPAVAGGMLYIESDDGYLYCLNAQSGVLNWHTSVDSNLHFTYANLMLTSSPVVTGGIVYIGSLDGNLYALERRHRRSGLENSCGWSNRVFSSLLRRRRLLYFSAALRRHAVQAGRAHWAT